MPVLMATEGETSGESPATLSTPASKLSQDDTSSPSPRRSNRTIKHPVLYGLHTLPSGLPRAVAAQIVAEQKRQEEEDSSDEERKSGPETPTKTTRKRAGSSLKNSPFAKRPKTGRKQQASPAKGRKRKGADDQGNLFDIIKAGKSALRAVVDDWIETYNKNKESAMVDLLQFFVQCCGCKGTVTPSMLEEDENINAIRQLTEQFDEESHEYPLIITGPTYKKFKSNFVDFVHTLMLQCQNGIIYDEYMLDTLVSWLIRLADSQVRAFRHTSTLAGLKVVSSLIDIAGNVNTELESTQRHLDVEERKVSSKKALDKLEGLENKKQELQQNIIDLEEMMRFIYQGIFAHRYSSLFLADKFLKYTVWNLHDKVGEVRLRTLQALEGLYSTEEFMPQLESLTERFKERLVAMTLDKDNDVAVEAVKLVTVLLRYGKLQEEECQQVELLVFCDHRQVAHAAGDFLLQRIASAAHDELGIKKNKRGSKKSERDINAMQLKKLIEFLITSEVHNHGAYLVDSLWNSTKLLKDWKLMTDILLDESGKEELDDADERALIEIMACAVRQVTQGQAPPGRAARKTGKDKRLLVGEKKDLSAHFMQVLPDLLSKYGADVDNAVNLVSVAQYFDLEEYGQRRLSKHLNELLSQLSDIAQKHTDDLVLEECGKTYRALTDSEYSLSTVAVVSRNNLIDEFVQKFKTSLKDGLQAGAENEDEDEDEDEDKFALKVSLKKITAFVKSHDLSSWELHNGLNTIIDYAQTKPVQDEILVRALTSAHVALLWSLKALDTSQPNKNDMKTLKKRVTKFFSQCDELIQYSTPGVQRQAFLILCDLFVVFSKQLKNNYPTLAPLVFEPDVSLQVRCRDYVINHVFAYLEEEELQEEEDDDETDEKVEGLSKKRAVLAAFCKLIAFNVFEMKFVAPVITYIGRGLGNFGDILKHTISKCKEVNKLTLAKTILLSLQQEFERLRDDQEDEGSRIPDSDEFAKLKDLARKFAQTFGTEHRLPASRQAMMLLQREGILYSFGRGHSSRQSPLKKAIQTEDAPPVNLQFLEVINEFSNRLIPLDRTGRNGVMKYLEEQAGDLLSKKGGQWSPLIVYKNGLKGHDAQQDKVDQSTSEPQKGSRARRKLPVEGETTEGEWLSKQTKAPKQKQQKAKATRGRPAKSSTTKHVQTSPPGHTSGRQTRSRRQGGENRAASPPHGPTEENQGGADVSSDQSPSIESAESSQASVRQITSRQLEGKQDIFASPSLESGQSSNFETPKRKGEPALKRKREEKSKEDEEEEEDDGEGGTQGSADPANDDGDFESVATASQRSWLASQPQQKKPRISYSKKDRLDYASKVLAKEAEEQQEDEGDEIEDYESDEGSESAEKAPIHTKRQKRDLPDDIFQESQESKNTDDSEDLTSAFD